MKKIKILTDFFRIQRGLIITLALAFSSALLHGAESKDVPNYADELIKRHTNDLEPIVLPINSAKNLSITLPAGFKLGSNSSSDQQLFLEFIPLRDNINNWSEIITVMGPYSSDPLTFIKIFKGAIEKQNKPFTSEISAEKDNGLNVAYYDADMPSLNPQKGNQFVGKNELLSIKVVGDNQGIWMVQYTIRYQPKDHYAQKQKLIDKITQFQGKVKVVKP